MMIDHQSVVVEEVKKNVVAAVVVVVALESDASLVRTLRTCQTFHFVCHHYL